MKHLESDVKEAKARFKEWLKPGRTVYTIIRHVSRSGMLRRISLYTIKKGRFIYMDYSVAVVLGRRIDPDKEGVYCHGCGMDMGFDLVYSLSRVLFKNGYKLNQRWL